MSKADKLRLMGGDQPALTLAEPDAYSDEGFQPAIGRTMKARPIPITSILPDPAQPRRAVPSAARAAWNGTADAASIQIMLLAWVQLAEHELGEPLHVYVAEAPPENFKQIAVEEATTPIAFKLLKLADIANDIFDRGLNDPISVNALEGGGYRIEYGERRWLAHWWLYLVTRDEKWTRINAFVRDDFSVWRQASENGARQQLNAIALARQLARLLMDIYKDTPFQSYADLVPPNAPDRAYYAQVADGDEFRIPRGWGEKIAAAMGLPNTQMLRQYRALLRLPDNIWTQGDDQSWPEGMLRPHTVSRDTVSNPDGHRDKPRALTKEEAQFTTNVRTAVAVLRHGDQVNVELVAAIEAFCKHLRESGKTFEAKALK